MTTQDDTNHQSPVSVPEGDAREIAGKLARQPFSDQTVNDITAALLSGRDVERAKSEGLRTALDDLVNALFSCIAELSDDRILSALERARSALSPSPSPSLQTPSD